MESSGFRKKSLQRNELADDIIRQTSTEYVLRVYKREREKYRNYREFMRTTVVQLYF